MTNILNWPHWVVDLVEENEHDYRISAHLLNPPTACPLCGTIGVLRPYGVREQRFMDLPVHAKRVGILVGRRRFKCQSCGRIAIEQLADMDEDHLMTKRLVGYIQEQSLNRTFVDVADLVGVDEKTVRLIFKDYVKGLEASYSFVTPPTLGIDELHLIGKPRCILTNVEQRTIIDMLKDRNQDTVQKYLSKLDEGYRVEVVCMDMWRPYRQAVAAVLPNATVVVDKFHIQRMANDALEGVRKALRESLSDKRRRTLKKDRYILLRRRRDLKDEDMIILESWTHNFPTLGAAYNAKENFFKIWDETDRQAAEDKYTAWRNDLPLEVADHFEPIVTAMTNWYDPIFAYFDTGLTNAYTEALNGLVKVIDRTGRGYSFDAIRAKVLYSEGSHMKRKPIYRDGWKKTGLPHPRLVPVGTEPLGYLYENVEYDPDDPKNVNFGVALSTFAQILQDYPNEPDSTTKSE